MDRQSLNRKVILDILRNSHDHPTAQDIYDRVRTRLNNISLGTIYRNLDFFERKGIIERLDFGYTKRRYDGNTEKHFHIRCRYCNKLEDVSCSTAEHILGKVEESTGFKEIDFKIEFAGICRDCQNKINTN